MATQARWVIVKSSNKTWSTAGGNGKPLQFLPQESHKSMKRKKDMTQMRSLSDQKLFNVPLGKHGGQLRIPPERMKRLNQSRNDIQLWMCLVAKVMFDAIKHNIA